MLDFFIFLCKHMLLMFLLILCIRIAYQVNSSFCRDRSVSNGSQLQTQHSFTVSCQVPEECLSHSCRFKAVFKKLALLSTPSLVICYS